MAGLPHPCGALCIIKVTIAVQTNRDGSIEMPGLVKRIANIYVFE